MTAAAEALSAETLTDRVRMVLDNDQTTYNTCRAVVRQAHDNWQVPTALADYFNAPGKQGERRRRLARRSAAADMLHGLVTEMVHRDADYNEPWFILANDVLGLAPAYVDWMELAEHYLAW